MYGIKCTSTYCIENPYRKGRLRRQVQHGTIYYAANILIIEAKYFNVRFKPKSRISALLLHVKLLYFKLKKERRTISSSSEMLWVLFGFLCFPFLFNCFPLVFHTYRLVLNTSDPCRTLYLSDTDLDCFDRLNSVGFVINNLYNSHAKFWFRWNLLQDNSV